MGAGPVTGSLERPSQGAPENRKATEAAKAERDQIAAARSALVGTHKAQTVLLLARHAAERRHVLLDARAMAAAHRSTVMSAITAKYADRLARVFDSGDARSAYAARERLKLEEAIEIAQVSLAMSRSSSAARQSRTAALKVTQRSERQGLALQQRRQRAVLAVMLGHLRHRGRAATRVTPEPARVSVRLPWRQHRRPAQS